MEISPVSSGLIILMADTFFHRFYTEAIKYGEKNKDYKRKFDDYTKGLFPETHESFAHLWWVYCVWGSAAAAIHNIQQEERPWPGCNNDTGKLNINEDPLAYLGILVDILEEWDRYSVMRRTYFTKYSAIQSKDVGLEIKDNKIKINFGDEERAKKIKKSLYNALESWNKIINIVV